MKANMQFAFIDVLVICVVTFGDGISCGNMVQWCVHDNWCSLRTGEKSRRSAVSNENLRRITGQMERSREIRSPEDGRKSLQSGDTLELKHLSLRHSSSHNLWRSCLLLIFTLYLVIIQVSTVNDAHNTFSGNISLAIIIFDNATEWSVMHQIPLSLL